MDRLDTASYASEFVYNFDYTLTGMRDLITEQRNSSTTWTSDYAYDAQDRVTSVTTPNGTVSYTYDPNGNRASMTTPSGTTSYQYNGNDQLTQVTAPMGQTNLTYTNVGLPDTLTYPNGVVKDYGYDDRDRLTSLTYQDGMTTLASYNYTLDTVGNRTRVDELGGDYTTWGYDNQYRLTNETIHDGGNTLSSSYTYDDVGNRTGQTVNGQATTYSYNALDQMTQSVTGGVTTTYAYDGRGNLATTTTGSDVTTYSWDALDRLTTVDLPAGADSAYTYDPNGYRVRQTLGSDTTHYLWDEFSAYGDVVRETNGTGTELANYTLANQQLIGQVRGGVANYYVQDGQGSTRALTNVTGDITDTYNYLAYGQLYSQTGTTTNPYLYTGQQFDSATGLYDLRARYYDPNVGRFLSRDTYPINYQNPIELNRYGYTANNPINRSDPTGYTFVETLKNIAATLTEGYVLLSAVGGAVTGLIGSYITYLGAASGSCGEDARQWATHVDPLKFALYSAGLGAVYGAAFAVVPGLDATIAAGSVFVAGSSTAHDPAQTVEDVQLSWCFFSQALVSITNDLLDVNEDEWYDEILVSASIAMPAAATATMAQGQTIGWGATVSRGAVTLSANAAWASLGFLGGLYAIMTIGLLAFSPQDPCPGGKGKWKVGDPINKCDSQGRYPNFEPTARERYWQNKAAKAKPGEFSADNLRRMRDGEAPQITVKVRWSDTAKKVEKRGKIEIIVQKKELHHKIPQRENPYDVNNINNIMEVWPWEHGDVDAFRRTGYTVLEIISE